MCAQPVAVPPSFIELNCVQFAAEEMDPESSTLWFAGKQMLPEKLLKDYLGRHEKTKVVVKLQKKGSGAPAREPVSAQSPQLHSA